MVFLAAAKDPISRIFNFCVNPNLKSIFVRLGEAENFKKKTRFFVKIGVSGWKRVFPSLLVNFFRSIFGHFLHQMRIFLDIWGSGGVGPGPFLEPFFGRIP